MSDEAIEGEANVDILDYLYAFLKLIPIIIVKLALWMAVGLTIGFLAFADAKTRHLVFSNPTKFLLEASPYVSSAVGPLIIIMTIFILIYLAYFLLAYFRLPSKARQVKYRVDAQSISLDNGMGSSKLPWAGIAQMRATARLLLFKSKITGQWFMVPRRSLSPADQTLLIGYARNSGVKGA